MYQDVHLIVLDVITKPHKSSDMARKYTDEILAEVLDDCDHDYISGLSLLGGEPFCNLDITLNLVKAFRARFGNTKTIWVWTGFLYEYLANDCTERRELLSYIDVLVDGSIYTTLIQT